MSCFLFCSRARLAFAEVSIFFVFVGQTPDKVGFGWFVIVRALYVDTGTVPGACDRFACVEVLGVGCPHFSSSCCLRVQVGSECFFVRAFWTMCWRQTITVATLISG